MPAPPRFVGSKPSQSFQRRGCNGDAREARVQTEDDARVTALNPQIPNIQRLGRLGMPR